MHAIDATGCVQKHVSCQACSMGFYVSGAQGPPYMFSFKDPPLIRPLVIYGLRWLQEPYAMRPLLPITIIPISLGFFLHS